MHQSAPIDEGEGRYARSWRLLGASWRYIRRTPSLLIFPAIAAAVIITVTAILVAPVTNATDGLGYRASSIVAILILTLPFTLITVTCNVGFLGMVLARLEGRDPTVADGAATIRARGGAILGWSLVSATVGALISLLEQIPLVGGLVRALTGIGWALATFFVVPILIVERCGVTDGIRRSGALFRRRWGETLMVDVGLGAALGLVELPGIIAVVAGIQTTGSARSLLIVLGLAWTAPFIVYQSALSELFKVGLLRETPIGPFGQSDLDAATRPRKRRWWSSR